MSAWLRVLLLALVACAAVPAPGRAQTATADAARSEDAAPDYAAWESTANRAEAAIEAGRASDAALEQLRTELVDWRTRFLAAQNVNQTRIVTLRDQIAALGTPPAEGETEPAELAARRATLNEQLARLQAPVRTAEEAYTRADGLIREIDTIIRDRQADALLQLGPSPLNPAHWSKGLSALTGTVLAIASETADAWRNPVQQAELRANLPAVLFYMLVALVLLLRGRRWMERATVQLARSGSSRSGTVISAVISLGQIVLPFIGLLALMKAIDATGLLGLRGSRVAQLIPDLGLIVFAARWLGGRVFPRSDTRAPMFTLSPERTAEARRLTSGLGGVIALAALARQIADLDNYGAEAQATLGFPLLVIAGLMIYRVGRILRMHALASTDEGGERNYRSRLVMLVARAAIVLAVVGPGLAAVGYAQAAEFFTYPAIASMALLAFLTLMQRFVVDVYALITGETETAADALIPVLIGFVLSLLALPALALIWGARVADLTELWIRFIEGVQIGGTRISPRDFLVFVAVFALGYMLTRLLQGALRASILPKTRIDPGGQNAILSGVGYLGIFLAAVTAVTSAGIDLSSLAIVAGALSVGIGFGLQNIVSNFISGIILLVERPISEGDWIEVGGNMGIVKAISVRSTRIETFDRTDVIVPNADFVSGTVTNWTRNNLVGRAVIPVGVAYGTDTRKVERILKEIAQEHPLVALSPEPGVDFMGFGADSLDFRIRAILRDVNFKLSVTTEINHRIAERFAEEGIEIPFAQRDIWLRNPEALRAPPAPAAASAPAEADAPPDAGAQGKGSAA